MGTEMRIGIAAGLVIVAATSVYFIYGSDRSDGDLLLTPETTAARSSADLKAPAKTSKSASGTSVAKRPTTRKPATTGERTAAAKTGRDLTVTRRTRNVGSPTIVRKSTNGGGNVALANRGDSSRPQTPPAAGITRPDGKANIAQTRQSPLVLSSADASSVSSDVKAPEYPARLPAQRTTKPIDRSDSVSKADSRSAMVLNPANESAAGSVESKSIEINTSDASAEKDKRELRVATRSTPPRTTADTNRRVAGRTQPVVRTAMTEDSSRLVAPQAEAWPKRHTIESGDTLSDISMKYYGTSRMIEFIVDANPDMKGPRSLRIGRELVIPEPGTSRKSSIVRLASDRDPPAARRTTNSRRTKSPVVVAPARKYTVRKGDTFYSIARDLCGSSSRWKEVFNANKSIVSNPSKLKPGMVLTIPS